MLFLRKLRSSISWKVSKVEHKIIREKVWEDDWTYSMGNESNIIEFARFKRGKFGLSGYSLADPSIHKKLQQAINNHNITKKEVFQMMEALRNIKEVVNLASGFSGGLHAA